MSETNSGEEGLSGGEGNSSSEILSAGGEAVNASEQGEVVLVAGSYTSPPHLSSQAHRSSPPAERNFASTAVVNTDEPSLPLTPGPFADVISNSNLVKFGPCEDISFTADAIHYFDQTIETKDLPFNENYNLANATQALAIVHAFSGHGVAPGTSNVDLQRAKLGLQAFKKLNFRMQEIGEKDGILVINNSMCTNPMAVVNSSQGLTRKQILLIGGLTKNLDFTPVKTYLKNSEHSAILFGPNPDQLRGMIGENLPWFESMDDAFRHAISSASAGNAIVLAPGCASAFPYANFRERGEAFERIAKEWLTNSLTDSG